VEVWLAQAHDDDTADDPPLLSESHLKSATEPGGHWQACLARTQGFCAVELLARASRTTAARQAGAKRWARAMPACALTWAARLRDEEYGRKTELNASLELNSWSGLTEWKAQLACK
jgi:hypothetical protein